MLAWHASPVLSRRRGINPPAQGRSPLRGLGRDGADRRPAPPSPLGRGSERRGAAFFSSPASFSLQGTPLVHPKGWKAGMRVKSPPNYGSSWAESLPSSCHLPRFGCYWPYSPLSLRARLGERSNLPPPSRRNWRDDSVRFGTGIRESGPGDGGLFERPGNRPGRGPQNRAGRRGCRRGPARTGPAKTGLPPG